ncbi:MAG: lamin tail domain-containing protein [Planctomycetota bacterium]|nr:lamin tail domain-containing protein [Planctomycetota bacterium]
MGHHFNKLSIPFLLVILAVTPATWSQSVLISEFLASNDDGLADEDGDFEDWIELYNQGDIAINLAGWYLSDDPEDLARWRFPSVELPAGGYLVLFASGKNRRDPTANLHTNFKLSSSGEYLALSRPDATTVEHAYSPLFPRQREDISYGLPMGTAALIDAENRTRYLVPEDDSLSDSWTARDFDDSEWEEGSSHTGYDERPAADNRAIPVANWSFDDDVLDQSGNGRHGEVVGALFDDDVPAAVGSGRSLRFDGQTDQLIVRGYNGITAGQPRTLAAWIKTTQRGGVIAAWGSSRPGNNWIFRVENTNGMRGAIGVDIERGYFVGNRNVADGRWHHVAVVLPNDTSSNTLDLHIYVDGQLDAGRPGGPNPSASRARAIDTGFAGNVLIGSGATSDYFSGLIDEVGLWDEALTAEQISALAGGTSAGELTSFHPLFELDLEDQLRGANSSVYLRLPFTLESPLGGSSLTLRMKYNDGYVAWLNGIEISRRNAPEAVSWNSNATAERPDRLSFSLDDEQITGRINLLEIGENVICFQGLNSAPDDPDFLLVPEIITAGAFVAERRYFTSPTPGAANTGGSLDFVEDVVISHEPGFYDEPLEVELACATPGALIRFTTNGSAPSLDIGETYSRPLLVDDTTVLRVGAFREDFESSYIDTRTYLFLDTPDGGGILHQEARQPGYPTSWGTLRADYEMDQRVVSNETSPHYDDRVSSALLAMPSLSIVMDIDDLFHPATGIYSNSLRSGVEWERPASLEFIYPDGREGIQINCGFRMQGGASRQPTRPKHNMRLMFKKLYGPGKLKFPVFEDSPVESFDTIVLRGGNGDSWFHPSATQRTRAQYIRDQWCRDAQLAMGQLSAHQNYMHLYINGLYWGLYHLIERPSAPFLAAHLGGDREEYDALNVGEPVDGDLRAWNTMMQIAEGGMSTPEAWEEIQQYLDVPNLVDWLILNFYVGNVDWDHNNWYAGRRRRPGEGYKFFCWDAERTFWNLNENRTGLSNVNRPTRLHQRLLDNDEYRTLFRDRVQRHFFADGVLTAQAARARWDAFAEHIELALAAETARWGDDKRANDPYNTRQEWATELNWFRRTYFPRRTSLVYAQLAQRGLARSAIDPPVITPEDGRIPPGGGGLEINMAATVGSIYYTLDGSDPRLEGDRVAASATRFTEPFNLPRSSELRARTLRRGEWSNLIERSFATDVSALRISEIMYNPRPPDEDSPLSQQDLEFIELVNTSEDSLDLTGVRFTAGIEFDFTSSGVLDLGPEAFVVIVKDLDAFAERYDVARILIAGEYRGNLANAGEALEIQDALGATIASFSYSDRWEPGTDGQGFSLELGDLEVSPEALGSPESWRESGVRDGTPGFGETPAPDGGLQKPGDTNQDGRVDLSDAVSLLGHLFLGTPDRLPCQDGEVSDPANRTLLDLNGDSGVDLADGIHLLIYLFQGGPQPAAGTECIRIEGCPQSCGE